MDQKINFLAVIVAALSTFLIGGIWYSPAVFGKAWMEANGFKQESLARRSMSRIFGLSFILGLIASVNLAFFIGAEDNPVIGGLWGFLAGFGWVATFMGTHYLFESRPLKLYLINAGYAVVALTVMGVILAAWK